MADPGQIEQVLMNLAVNARDAMPERRPARRIETANVELDEAYAALHPDVAPGRYVMLAVSDTGVRHGRRDPARTSSSRSSPPRSRARAPAWASSTVYGIVQAERRRTSGVYSEPGRGTTSRSTLPLTVRRRARQPRRPIGRSRRRAAAETILLRRGRARACARWSRDILRPAATRVLEAERRREALLI